MNLSELEIELLDEEHILRLHHHDYEDLDVDYNNWHKRSRRKAEERVSYLMTYLNTNVMEDDFGIEDELRLEWERTLPEEARKYLDNQPLRVDTIISVHLTLEDLKISLRAQDDTISERIDATFEDHPDTYSQLSFKEKHALCIQAKHRIYDVLKSLTL